MIDTSADGSGYIHPGPVGLMLSRMGSLRRMIRVRNARIIELLAAIDRLHAQLRSARALVRTTDADARVSPGVGCAAPALVLTEGKEISLQNIGDRNPTLKNREESLP